MTPPPLPSPADKRALTQSQRLALVREGLRIAKEEGFAAAEVEVTARGDMRLRIEKGRAAPAEIKL